MFANQDISEAGDRKFLWNFYSLLEKNSGCTDRDEVVYGLNGCYLYGLVDEMERGFLAFIDG